MAPTDAWKIGRRYIEIDNFSLPTTIICDFLGMFKIHYKLLQTFLKSPDLLFCPRETKALYFDGLFISLNPWIELDFCINILDRELLFIGDFGLEILWFLG